MTDHHRPTNASMVPGDRNWLTATQPLERLATVTLHDDGRVTEADGTLLGIVDRATGFVERDGQVVGQVTTPLPDA